MRSGLKLIGLSLLAFLAAGLIVYFAGRSATPLWPLCLGALATVWVLIAGFTLFFFRDPTARTPLQPGIIVAPAHGTVDVIDEQTEARFMGGPCRRVSIFLSVFNVHVQNAPVAGKVACVARTAGQFVNAMRTDSALYNENVLLGFESSEAPGEKVGARMIAGLIARRIVPFAEVGDSVARGERVSLIQFGSRCDLYFPLHYKVQVKLGDKVVGGETVMASKS